MVMAPSEYRRTPSIVSGTNCGACLGDCLGLDKSLLETLTPALRRPPRMRGPLNQNLGMSSLPIMPGRISSSSAGANAITLVDKGQDAGQSPRRTGKGGRRIHRRKRRGTRGQAKEI